jgi:hypothetical protein
VSPGIPSRATSIAGIARCRASSGRACGHGSSTRHCERAGQGDLDHAVGTGAQEFNVAQLDRPQSADRAHNARHDDGAARTPAHFRGIVQIDPGGRRRQTVRIAFAADLAIGDDVDAGALHVADREPGRVVLCRFEPRLGPRDTDGNRALLYCPRSES